VLLVKLLQLQGLLLLLLLLQGCCIEAQACHVPSQALHLLPVRTLRVGSTLLTACCRMLSAIGSILMLLSCCRVAAL
jgi:hypothetical protein